MNYRPPGRRCSAASIARLFTLLCSATLASHVAAAKTVAEIEELRDHLKAALAYRDQAASEANAWRTQQAEIDALATLAAEEHKRLTRDLAALRQTLDALEQKRQTLATREALRARFVTLMNERLPALTEELRAQHTLWPDVLQERTRANLATLAEQRDAADFFAQQRSLEAALAMLEQAGEFQSQINRSSLMRALPDGREALFEVIYLGLASGYYHSAELRIAGTISFDGKVWIWRQDDTLAAPLARYLKILDGDAQPTLVNLPVEVRRAEGSQ
jgi:hypothetical protein